MKYAGIEDLMARASLDELAVRAAPDRAAVDGALLREVLALRAKGLSLEDILEDLVARTDCDGRAEYEAEDLAALAPALGRLERALADAAAEIQGWIGARYPDLADPPEALKTYAVDIALYRLYRPGDKDDPRACQYRAAVAWLRDVARGAIDLAAPASDPDTGAGVTADAPARVFTRETLADY